MVTFNNFLVVMGGETPGGYVNEVLTSSNGGYFLTLFDPLS